ncbi:MAG: acetyl-CoA carboxylase biotin carboxyl carrier protein [Candidatus Omnitrophica bacterium]|nr:acetyl-CoA carboxylase biotin carboxyl carrier protein [Candidatus Omnitrophota bacterium]MBU1996458.1 acetyl-CoA carboxylase biotin carboxyl carrier protein [Candidatus Omnitrophota bacterium]
MNLKEIREMINLMNDNDLIEIEIERSGSKVKLKKASAQEFVAVQKVPVEYAASVQAQAQAAALATAAEQSNADRKEINSPMVGTFYRAPSPDSSPYVELGQVVEKGQVVCIIEAMKLMNEIKSEVRGKIVEIPVENAQPVEFDQTLFYIEAV